MLDKLLGNLGAFAGNIMGGGVFSAIGRSIGSGLGAYIERSDHKTKEFFHEGYMLNKFIINQDIYSQYIPILLGQARITGKLIWCDKLKTITHDSTKTNYFRWGKKKSIIHNTTYKYSLSFALSICEGEIKDICRVWVGEEIMDLSYYTSRLYKGKQDQRPDPLIESILGKSSCPAFRDHAYIVFEDFPLSEFGNSLPRFSFEVQRQIVTEGHMSVEDSIKSIVIIPGSGEYVYDTEVAYKYLRAANGRIIEQQPINSCNYKQIANSVANLDQLEFTCKNIEWTAPVVCWFTDSLNIQDCHIMPAVEFLDKDDVYSEKWEVGKYNRQTAREISKDKNHNPRYGGTTSDNSVLRYLKELKRRQYKILFYPMLAVDNHAKSWRGHITGCSEDVYEFFNKDKGYNEFILHYANLVKGKVDAFIIGSELIGITQIRNHKHEFLAVTALVNLAKQVRKILGNEVLITYAADWSEYHHTDGGWYNLDPLWSSEDINFIGIDAYFPITNINKAIISDSEIIKGFSSGEGYDYYIEGNSKKDLAPEWAWKNIGYWWDNEHINPDGNKTPWKPRSKKIWFTEFGFPSIDKSTNQPNIFFDPECLDGGMPEHSSGGVDFAIQRRAIALAIKYFKSQTYLSNYFLWTWDARPSPAWPFLNYWHDSHLWSRGHWVNNKFTSLSLAGVLAFLCLRADMSQSNINLASLDEGLEGIVFARNIKIIDAINLLRIIYLFDVDSSSNSNVNFIKRGDNNATSTICTKTLAISEQNFIKTIENSTADIALSFHLSFFNKLMDYKEDHVRCFDDESKNIIKHSNIFLPIVISSAEAKLILSKLINHTKKETKEIVFSLPQFIAHLKPGSVFTYHNDSQTLRARILYCFTENYLTTYGAVIEDQCAYRGHYVSSNTDVKLHGNTNIMTGICELPYIPYINMRSCIYYGHTRGYGEKLFASCEAEPKIYLQTLSKNAIIALVKEFRNAAKVYTNLIDNDSKIQLFSYSQLPEFSIDDFYRGKSLCIFGQEIIGYQNVTQIANKLYEISGLMRGLYGTHTEIDRHQAGEKIMLLSSLEQIPISDYCIGKNLYFAVKNTANNMLYYGYNSIVKQVQNLNYKVRDNILFIDWEYEEALYDNWIDIPESNFIYEISITSNKIIHKFTTQHESFAISCSILGLSDQYEIAIIVVRQDDAMKGHPTKIVIDL